MSETVAPPWYHSVRFRRTALVLFAIILVAEGVVAIFFRDNDFLCHRHVGQAFLAGDPYRDGFFMYPLGRIMMNGLLAIGPLYLTRAICFGLAMLAIFSSYRMWRQLSDTSTPTHPWTIAATAIFSATLMLPFLLRDLDECGLQLYLLFFLTAGFFSIAHGHFVRAGFWLATAVTYKLTPVLVLPYLLWKRQWQAAGWTVAFIGVWAIAPMPFVGVNKTIEGQQRWLEHMQNLSHVRKAYPDQLLEPQRTDNISLVAMIARNLETYTPDNPLYVDHPLFFQPGSLSQEAAYRTVRLVMLGIGLVLAWRFRRSGAGDVRSNGMVNEWAAVCLLCAVASPICWKQHLVLALPAVFLVVRATLTQPAVPRWRVVGLMLVGVSLCRILLFKRDWSTLFHAYKIDTLAILIVLVLVLTLPEVQAEAAKEQTPPPEMPKAMAA